MFKTAILFLSVLVLGAIADDEHGKDVVNLVKDSFDADVGKKPHLVMFFAPWCGHCKRLAPTWQELAEKYNKAADQEVVIAKVDCTVETALCSAQDVTGYPTLKFFKSGAESSTKHRGGRDLDALVAFIDEQMGRAPAKEEKLVEEPEIAVAEDGLFILGEKSFAKHIEKGSHFIKFYAPWCGHCKKMSPAWDELAKDVDGDKSVSTTIAKVDCTKHQSVCQEQGVGGYPTIMFFRDGKKVEQYRGGRAFNELKDYVVSMKSDKDEAPEEKADAAPANVAVLDGKSFEESIKTGVAFVKFYAPWCGHCKKLAPTWEDLGAKYAENEGISIAKVDCTAGGNANKELCDGQGVKGFPTLNIYKDGKKITEYSGKRGLEELEAFVKEHSETKKDEL